MGVGPGADRDGDELARGWWLLALVGALSIAAGVIVLVEPSISLATLAVVTGIFLLIDGIVEVVSALLDSIENRGLMAVLGVVSAIAGVILIRHPTRSVTAIALLLGLWLLVAGVIRLIRSLGERRGLWSALLALLEIIAGIVIVSSPGIGVSTLALLFGISLIVRGLGLLMVGWLLRSVDHLAKASLSDSAAAESTI